MRNYLHIPTKTSHIYECPYCSYRASNTLGIRLHMKLSHKTKSFELSKDFLCDLCGKIFYSERDIRKHIKKYH